MFSMNTLKDEAIETHLKTIRLHTNIFSEQLSQTFNTLDNTIDNISFTLKKQKSINTLKNQFDDLLTKNSYIRSINLVDLNEQVIYSSNEKNIGIKVNTADYYPIPLFSKSILRFGITKYGRDISQSDSKLTYLPISKLVTINKNEYNILLIINTDSFLNRYSDNLLNNVEYLEVLRVDGKSLFSNNYEYEIGDIVNNSKLFRHSLDKTIASGIEKVNSEKYLVAYQLTDTYPLNVVVRSKLDKTLEEWENKRLIIIFLLTFLVSIAIVLVLTLIVKYDKSKNKEIKFQKEQVKNQKKFQIIFEQNNFIAAILDTHGTILQMNSIFLDFLPEANKEIIGMKFYELSCWKNKNKKLVESKFKDFNGKTKIDLELVAIDKDNSPHFIDLLLTSIEYKDTIELVVIGTDTTEDKKKEEKLKNAYTVFNNTNDGIVITDAHANIIDVNKAFTINSGYKLNEVIGHNPSILKSNRHNKTFYKDMWSTIERTNLWHGEIVNSKKDGSLYIELLTINKIVDDKGIVKNYIGVFTNITKQKEQEKLLKDKEQILFQQSKMASMGEMLENIAHQWRQPLSIISTSASGLQAQKEFNQLDDKFLDSSLCTIVESTQHLSKTIDDFRNFFKPDKEKINFLLGDALEKSLNIVNSKFKNRSIKIEKNIVKILLKGFENELVQVIMNILNNAKDILEDKDINDRFIIINSYEEDKVYAVLTIQDSGGGIKNDILGKVFEPYFTTKHQKQGTGIGLYMSEEIISKHMHGKLTVENRTFNHNGKQYTGALFKIYIPLVD